MLSKSSFPFSIDVQGYVLSLLFDLRPTMVEVFPGGSEVKASAWNEGDPGLIPGLGRPPGEGNGNPL